MSDDWPQRPELLLRSVTMGSGAKAKSPGKSVVAKHALFRNPDFLIPYLAESQSIGGDQIGRVALSILVFDRTGSTGYTALTYALTFVPSVVGGFVLGGLGDRLPRRLIMVSSDLLRAALFAVLAIHGLSVAWIAGIVAVAFFVEPAFSAAFVSRLADVLGTGAFRTATGLRMITAQAANVVGFAVGGVVVAVLSPAGALLVNAATFALSAVIIGVFLGGATPPTSSSAEPTNTDDPMSALSPARSTVLLRDPRLRHLLLMTALASFFVVPEGLAVPVAHELGASTTVAGLLLAAGPLGSVLGAAALVRAANPSRGLQTAHLMSIACGVPLIVTAALPPWPVVFLLWAASGALWAYQVEIATAFVAAVDERVRSRAIARASAVLVGGQGVGLLVFGAAGGWLGAQWGVACAGVFGVAAALGVVLFTQPQRAAMHAAR